jgi:gamma-glutamylputrescine oxidase
MFSFWETDTFLSGIDVAIIGSGIVGLNAAIALREREPSLRVVVLERGALPTGASTRNAGFACFGSLTELLDDLSTTDENTVFDLAERRFAGLRRLRERVGDAAMQYEHRGGFEIFEAQNTAFAQCRDAIDYFNKNVQRFTKQTQTYRLANDRIADFGLGNTAALIENTCEGQIHTGRMMHRLLQIAYAKGVEVWNGATLTAFEEQTDGVQLTLRQGNQHIPETLYLKTQQVLFCTNGFTKRLLPDLDVQAARNQVLITEPIPNLRLRGCFHAEEGYFYARNVGDRVLFGGGRHLDKQTEFTDAFGTTELIQSALLDRLRNTFLPEKYYPQSPVVAQWWSGILGVGSTKQPIVQRLSPRMTAAVRMGGMGVAIGALVGEEGAALVLEN